MSDEKNLIVDDAELTIDDYEGMSGKTVYVLKRRIAELEQALVEKERHKELLRDLSMAAQLYISKNVGDPDVYPDVWAAWKDYHASLQAAIDGGALEGP